MAATLSPRAISVSSMSKAYGLPGLRVGWAVCRDPELAETLLAAKEQMVICGATIDEAIAGRVLTDRARILPPILDDVRARLDIVRDWMRGQDTFEWIEPAGGVVGLVRFAPDVDVDTARFYEVLLARVRHVRRPRTLVRGRRPPLPPRLRLAHRTRAPRRPRRTVRRGRHSA